MTDVNEQRINLQQEELRYRASISESTAFRLGASTNFTNNRQFDTYSWMLNGPYNNAFTSSLGNTAVDGGYDVLFDAEIVGFSMFNAVSGSAGTTEIDIRRLTTVGGSSSIFSIRPAISSVAPDETYMINKIVGTAIDPIANFDNNSGVGITYPVYSITELDQGDFLVFDIISAQTDAENLTVLFHFRPR